MRLIGNFSVTSDLCRIGSGRILIFTVVAVGLAVLILGVVIVYAVPRNGVADSVADRTLGVRRECRDTRINVRVLEDESQITG